MVGKIIKSHQKDIEKEYTIFAGSNGIRKEYLEPMERFLHFFKRWNGW